MPESHKSQDIVYRINDRDEIIQVNDAWDQFAAENDGSSILSERVLHRSLWDFITDAGTRELYRQMLARLRDGTDRVRFELRCDSPGCRRLLEMRISRREDGTIEFRTRTRSLEARDPPVPLMSPAPGGGGRSVLRSCSWCKKVQVDGRWVEVEEAVGRQGLFRDTAGAKISHGICETCFKVISASLDLEPQS